MIAIFTKLENGVKESALDVSNSISDCFNRQNDIMSMEILHNNDETIIVHIVEEIPAIMAMKPGDSKIGKLVDESEEIKLVNYVQCQENKHEQEVTKCSRCKNQMCTIRNLIYLGGYKIK